MRHTVSIGLNRPGHLVVHWREGEELMGKHALPLSSLTLSWMLAPSTLSEAMTPASQGTLGVEIWPLVHRK